MLAPIITQEAVMLRHVANAMCYKSNGGWRISRIVDVKMQDCKLTA